MRHPCVEDVPGKDGRESVRNIRENARNVFGGEPNNPRDWLGS